MIFLNSATDYVKFHISLQKYSSPGTIHLTIYKRRHISASGTARTVAKPARLKPMGKCFSFNSGNDYVKFNISLHKQSSPGTYCLTNYKRRHISASGIVQTVAKPARFKPIGKGSYSIPRKVYLKFSISLQKYSSPGTIHLNLYKRCHVSASGTAQTVAKPARLKPARKCSS